MSQHENEEGKSLVKYHSSFGRKKAVYHHRKDVLEHIMLLKARRIAPIGYRIVYKVIHSLKASVCLRSQILSVSMIRVRCDDRLSSSSVEVVINYVFLIAVEIRNVYMLQDGATRESRSGAVLLSSRRHMKRIYKA